MSKALQIKIGQFSFDCRVAGDPADEMVILLHGFPESSYMWIRLMEDVSALGFYCLAPDLRGISKGARPNGRKHYAIEELCKDVLDIAGTTGRNKFHLIGHDWGAIIGWKLVHDHPELFLSWTALSVPHYQAFGEAVVQDEVQKRMSRYMKFFMWPLLPEIVIRKNDFEGFRKQWQYCGKDEVDNYLSIFREKQALTAALNYYRSNYLTLRKAARTQILGDIMVPTLFVWGEQDPAVGATGVEKGHAYIKGYYQFLKLDAGHWPVQSNYPDVRRAIGEHLIRFKSSPTAARSIP